MKRTISCVFFLALLVLQGCVGGVYFEKIVNGYFLSAIDVKTDMLLGYQDGDFGVGVVGSTVFAVGYNDEYIIVKQHPRKFPNPPDKSITNYFIVPIKDQVHASPDENKIGPLTKEEFVIKRKELGISDSLTFTKVFSELE